MRRSHRLLSRFGAALLVLTYISCCIVLEVSFSSATHVRAVNSEQFLRSDFYFRGECSAHVTITSAYYNLGKAAKHSSKNFAVWNERFFLLPDNMVIFTDTDTLETIRSIRLKAAGCTVLVTQALNKTRAANMTDWASQFEKDHEKYHSPELYILWSQKSFWLASTSSVNPFKSSYFFWADSGQFRDDSFIKRYLAEGQSKWISHTNFIPRNKVLFLSIQPFTKQETSIDPLGKRPVLNSRLVRLGGGNFGGNAQAVQRFANLYATEVARYLHEDVFVGKDQPLYGSTCISHVDLCFLVDARKVLEIHDPWFALQPVLHGVTKPIPEYSW